MADTIYLNDGSYEVLLADDDPVFFLRRLIREKLGRDTEELFNETFLEHDDDDDGEDWEKIADGYRGLLWDTLEEINGILNYAKGARVNKETLIRKLQNCKDNLFKNL